MHFEAKHAAICSHWHGELMIDRSKLDECIHGMQAIRQTRVKPWRSAWASDNKLVAEDIAGVNEGMIGLELNGRVVGGR